MRNKPFHLFISVGEESADAHASKLCQELTRRIPSLSIAGFGGGKMKSAGVDVLYPLPDLALIGFVEVVKHIPTVFRLKRQAIRHWTQHPPDAVLFVDFPGFNLRLAREAHRRGIPVLYYIAPQVWAWREQRVETMRNIIHQLYVIFPFEEPYFQRHGIQALYVGHPLIEQIPAQTVQQQNHSLNSPLIGLLPGSRRNELKNNLPVLLRAAELYRRRNSQASFLFPLADALPESFLREFDIPSWIQVCRDSNYHHRRQLTCAWTASGTATVENALLGIPMAVVYKTSRFNMMIGRRLVRIPYIGMVNLIAQKGICPEFIQEQFQPESLVRWAEEILSSPERYHEMKTDLDNVRRKIGDISATRQTAGAIEQFLLTL